MKIIRTETYNKLIKIKENYEALANQLSETRKELLQAKDLKTILEKLSSDIIPLVDSKYIKAVNGWDELIFPDNVLQYTEDILGGKVIKQEGNKCILIEKDGSVKTGLTKQKVDKGFTYKLIRR